MVHCANLAVDLLEVEAKDGFVDGPPSQAHPMNGFVATFTVADHNQNNPLRPNSKMVRAVCLNCHGLQFSLNALADTDLILRNF